MLKENIEVESIKEYYIAYFDLLGYKQFFKDHSDKVEFFLNDIHKAICDVKDYLQIISSSFLMDQLGQVSIRTKVFSDNILLCLETGTTPSEYPRFLVFMLIIADIQRNFILRYGLFLRGGITIGTLSFNDDFVFGQGLIDAVTLEEEAVYPRIIIGKSIVDYYVQTHFVKKDELKKALAIGERVIASEEISDDELKFYISTVSNIKLEKYCSEWSRHLIFHTSDGASVLNYLYRVNLSNMVDQMTMEQAYEEIKRIFSGNYQKIKQEGVIQKEILDQHREHIIQKINEFRSYDNLDVSADKEAGLQEHVLKKYLWVLSFHNRICERYNLPEYRIKAEITCDIRFMRLTAEIIEEK